MTPNALAKRRGIFVLRRGQAGRNIVRENKTLVLAIVLCLVAACEGPTEDDSVVASPQQPLRHLVSDPAMDPPGAELPVALAVKADVLPTLLTVDEAQQRIFIPDLGWLPLAEFWDVYENNPARLPPDLDYKAVHQLKLSMAGKKHDDA